VTARVLSRVDVVGLIAVVAGLGALLGIAWWSWAPRVVLDVFGDATFPAEFQPGGYIADDGIAALACMVGGVLTIAVATLLARHRSGAALLGAVDLDAAIAAAGDGGQVEAPLTLRMPGVLVLWPLASAVVFTLGSWLAWVIRPVSGPMSRPVLDSASQ